MANAGTNIIDNATISKAFLYLFKSLFLLKNDKKVKTTKIIDTSVNSFLKPS